MKYKTLLLLILMCLTIGIADAVIVDKPLNITVSNCYSVNISAEQTSGVISDVSFVGCDKIDTTNFICKCWNNENKNFTLIMRSDNAIVRNIREYDIYLSVKYFETYKKTMSVSVEDGGDYYETTNTSWNDKDIKYKIKEVPVYINQTVYVDKIVEVPKEVMVYRNITVQNITYIENVTRINDLEKEVKFKQTVNWIAFISILILAGLLLQVYYNAWSWL